MEFINKTTIKLDKEINEIDQFVYDFIKVLQKHTKYVIISGYVSILFGRARATEDVDVFIEKLDFSAVKKLYTDLQQHGYWCLNTEDEQELFQYLHDGLAVRFALKDQSIPNFEVKFIKDEIDEETLRKPLAVVTSLGKIMISTLERQIAFKRFYLKSDKDIEDADFIQDLFKEHLDKKKIEHFKKIITKRK